MKSDEDENRIKRSQLVAKYARIGTQGAEDQEHTIWIDARQT